jgi:hypothetical protein
LAAIPAPKLLETPDGIANELFGNVTMVTEFISCFKELLKPKDDTTVINVTTGEHTHRCTNLQDHKNRKKINIYKKSKNLRNKNPSHAKRLESYRSELPQTDKQ